MIKTETLFILGAGASAPFGYPIGIELRRLICERSHNPIIIRVLNPQQEIEPWYSDKVNQFVDEFTKSGLYSIDSFLENRNEFMDIGKIAIASYLIPCEKDQRLREEPGNWYMYLYDRLKTSFDNFDKNAISFITFNYDRSLEQFFYEALKCQFNKNQNECVSKLNNIPIVHLYGQLGSLPWQKPSGREYCYNPRYSHGIREAVNDIKLITQERAVNESREFQTAYRLIKKAQNIFILGFSFDETNLERLNIELMEGKTIIATSIGLESSKQAWVNNYFKTKIKTPIYFTEVDALSLLKKDLRIE